MVPKRFRMRLSELGDESVWVTNALGSPNHLDVRPASLFRSYQAKIGTLTETPQLLLYKRFYFGSAIEVDIDSAGRMLIPVSLRNRGNLTDKVAFVGLDAERFQLWRPEDLDMSFEYCNQHSGELLAHLAELERR